MVKFPMPNGIVIFDFDGTLTCQQNNMTMWNLLWARIGKAERGAQLYSVFHKGIISRELWFQETAREFRGIVNRTIVRDVAETISLRDNAIELFKSLTIHGYELYILSGGIRTIIDEVLASSRLYFKDISANKIVFNEEDEFVHLGMTPYDYEGKAKYIEEVILQTDISCDYVYYVGNSMNDLSVLSLPIKTICISPIGLSQNQILHWDYVCDNLESVAYFILG